jgi:transaldolase
MVKEGKELVQVAPNVVVKCPLTKDGLKAVKYLTGEGIRVNQTLCFSAPQALLSAKAGAVYISPFLGRLDDIGHVGMDLVRDICEIYRNYGYKTQVLAASIRSPIHVIDAAKAGPTWPLCLSTLEMLMKQPTHHRSAKSLTTGTSSARRSRTGKRVSRSRNRGFRGLWDAGSKWAPAD